MKYQLLLNGQTPTLLTGGSRRGESDELNTSLKSLQFAFKLYERQRREGVILRACASRRFSKSWHERFVEKLSREGQVEGVRVNVDDVAIATTWSSNAPTITKRI